MPLTDTQVRSARAGEKDLRLADGRGLYLLITAKGQRWWRLRYTFDGREKMISLGIYPDVPLKEARQRREESRALIARGVDPSAQRRAEKRA
jgi:hypothetical protein